MLSKNLCRSFSTHTIQIPTPEFHLLPEGAKEFPTETTTTTEELIEYYTQLNIMRQIELTADKLYKNK